MEQNKYLTVLGFVTSALMLVGCGGGGGSSPSPSPQPSSSASSVSTSSAVSSSSSSAANFSLSQNTVNFSAELGWNPIAPVSITGTLRTPASKVYIFVDASKAPLVQAATVDVNETTGVGTLSLTPVLPQNQDYWSLALFPGVNTNTVTVRACLDEKCVSEYSGSPQTITVNYTLSAPSFQLSPTNVVFTMTAGQALPQDIPVNLTAPRFLSKWGTFIQYNGTTTTSGWLSLGSKYGGDGQEKLDLSVTKALPAGTYTASVGVMGFDAALTQRINVILVVDDGTLGASATNLLSRLTSYCNGNIFIDSVCAGLADPSIFEVSKAGGAPTVYPLGADGNFITQKIIDSNDGQHNKVIDIAFNNSDVYNGLPRLSVQENPLTAIPNNFGYDLSAFANGFFEFDIKMLSRGTDNQTMFAKIECYWPCSSKEYDLGSLPLNAWTHIKIPVADLVSPAGIAYGLDLEHVSTLYQIFPKWGTQRNVHYQLDNIQWTKN